MGARHERDAHAASAPTGRRLEDIDLSGSDIERLELRNAQLRRVRLNGSRLRSVDLRGVEVRAALLDDTRLIGLEMRNVEITAELDNVTVNGVDIGPLVEAELDRRHPDRRHMRPDDADGFRHAWSILERFWTDTTDHARRLDADLLHEQVDGEWSFIETLRHLKIAIAAWVDRMILGEPTPWHPLDLPWDEAPGWPDIPWDRTARPTLDQVLAVRSSRHASVRSVLDDLTDERLAATVSMSEPGWPTFDSFPLRECLTIIVNEHWEHRLYAARDLTRLDQSDPSRSPVI